MIAATSSHALSRVIISPAKSNTCRMRTLTRRPRPGRPNGVPLRGRVQDRLVDDVVVAIPAPDGLEPVELEVFEQSPVEGRDLLATVERASELARDVVLGVLDESRHDRRDVAVALGSKMRSTRASICRVVTRLVVLILASLGGWGGWRESGRSDQRRHGNPLETAEGAPMCY